MIYVFLLQYKFPQHTVCTVLPSRIFIIKKEGDLFHP